LVEQPCDCTPESKVRVEPFHVEAETVTPTRRRDAQVDDVLVDQPLEIWIPRPQQRLHLTDDERVRLAESLRPIRRRHVVARWCEERPSAFQQIERLGIGKEEEVVIEPTTDERSEDCQIDGGLRRCTRSVMRRSHAPDDEPHDDHDHHDRADRDVTLAHPYIFIPGPRKGQLLRLLDHDQAVRVG
jgi:hypothetical protein